MQPNVWAITSYFNPTGSRRRRINFEIFRQKLNVPLVAVELATDQPFELGPHDAQIVVQIRSSSVLWHKERLLNIAVQHVPRGVSNIAWIDCDVIFGNDTWAEEASEALRQSALVQPFDYVFNLPARSAGDSPVDTAGAEPVGPTFVSRFGNRQISQEVLRAREPSRVRLLLGLAWVARRSLIESHGFYDGLIVGSGDRAMTLAAYGLYAEVIDALRMNAPSVEHYLQWAKPFHAAVAGNLRAIKGDLYHLWHGEAVHRKYLDRHVPLKELGFDPNTDIRVSPQGTWEWATDKPELHEYLRTYFLSRQEDG
jgi:hypothetical protein